MISFERVLRWALVSIAVAGLAAGIAAHVAGRSDLAVFFWTLGTAPVVGGLAVSIVRDFLAGRFGVDGIALDDFIVLRRHAVHSLLSAPSLGPPDSCCLGRYLSPTKGVLQSCLLDRPPLAGDLEKRRHRCQQIGDDLLTDRHERAAARQLLELLKRRNLHCA